MTVGSSPLTRGKHPLVAVMATPEGLIPAHAGKTGIHSGNKSIAAAHPRSRGENMDGVLPNSEYTGSSPLTRGKPHGLRRRY